MKKISILVIENENAPVADLAQILQGKGYCVASTKKNLNTLAFSKNNQPDLIIIDSDSLSENHVSSTSVNKQLESIAVPIIFVAAQCNPHLMQQIISTNTVYGYLEKPIKPQELDTVIQIALHRFDTYQKLSAIEQRAQNTEQQLTQLAYFDALTGLANRPRLQEELARMISQAKRERHQLAVVFMDLDHFKHVNDSLGHEAGDKLLQAVAVRLTDTLRESDCIARLGGDEFVLVIPKINEFNNTLTVMEKVRAAISHPMYLEGKEIVVTPSLGISIFPDDGEDTQTLLRCADTALYNAKAEGRNRFSFFRPELAEQAHARLELENALRKAVENKNFFLTYQPIINLSDGTLVGFEALIRWQSPNGAVGPEIFIPIAEETGLILPIGTWVLSEACQAASQWPEPLVLHVNCSARQLREDRFIQSVTQALSHSQLAPHRLCLELTEDIMHKGDKKQITRLNRLKALGVELSIDDYGTGYSSLANLKRYSPGNIKVDGVFISDLDKDPDCLAIVSATIAMAHALGIKTVAEGVETEIQAAHLRQLKCDSIQGFLCSQPLPHHAVSDLIHSQRFPIANSMSFQTH